MITTSLLALGVNGASAGALYDSGDVENMTVMGTRIPTPINQEGRSVSIITGDEIELKQQRFLYEALRSVPGVQITRSGSFGSLASVSIRGLEADQTLVVQDGIVLNNPGSFDNSFNFANFDTSDIERIEVIRGAQSTIYGSDAIGGVINIITKGGEGDLGASGFVEGGSFATFRGAATVKGGSEKVSGRATVSATTSDGYSTADAANGNTEDDGYDNITFSARGKVKPGEDVRIDLTARYQDSENDFDGFAFGVGPVDGDQVAKTEEMAIGGAITWDMLPDLLSHRASITYSRIDQINLDGGLTTFDSVGERTSYEYQATVKPIDNVTLVAGAEYDDQQARTAVGFGGNQEITTKSGYGLLQVAPHERVTLTGGVRYDKSSDFGSETTFNAAGAFDVPVLEAILRASYSEGFRAPTAAELGFNPDLFAETSKGWDVGLERSFLDNRLTLGLTYFDQKVDNLIAFDLAQFTFMNIQKFSSRGVEVSAGLEIDPTFSVGVAYTYLDAFNVSTDLPAGNQPDNKVTVDATWKPVSRLTLSGSFTFNGKEPTSSGPLDSYTLVNLRGEYALTEALDVTVRVDNAFDENYQDNFGYGTAPLSAYVGLRADF
jgi:vitamin B12 transporter